MKKLTLQDQYYLVGGTKVTSIVIYTLIKAGLYKIIKSTSGKIFIPKIIRVEWKSN